MLLYGFVECMLVALERIRGWSSGQQWLISGALQLCKLASVGYCWRTAQLGFIGDGSGIRPELQAPPE
jgi:hypothetical protein